jgi:hypothetical protein
MKPQLKRFIRSISLLIVCTLVPWNIIFPCGPSLTSDEAQFCLFNIGVDGSSGLKTYTYTTTLYELYSPEMEPDYKRNCREWAAYTGNKASEKDIYTIQYSTEPVLFIKAFERNKWDCFKHNSFIGWLTKKHNRPALDYLLLAKQAEAASTFSADAWDTTHDKKQLSINELANLAKNKVEKSDVFLQQRYAFQAIKLWYYTGNDFQNAVPSIKTLYLVKLEGRKTIVAAWAKIYYAMVQNDPNMRTRYLLKAFDESAEKKQFAFLRVEKKDLQKLEQVTKDVQEKILINVVRALKTKSRSLLQIREITAGNAHCKYLPMLIGREINKLETWLWSPEMLGFYEEEADQQDDYYTRSQLTAKLKSDRVYLREVRAFVDSLSQLNESAEIRLAQIHLYNMERNYAMANQLLKMLPIYSNKNHETQRLIETIITTLHTEDILQPKTKQHVALAFQKLLRLNEPFKKQLNAKENEWQDDADAERNDDVSELLLMLSRAYQKKGDRVTAGLLYTKANIVTNNYDGWEENSTSYHHIAWFDRYATAEDLDGVLALKHKSSKTAFEKLLTPTRWAKDDMYRDLKGTIFFRQKKYAEALNVFKTMDTGFWRKNYSFKYYLPLTAITYTGVIPEAGKSLKKYKVASKLLITQDVVKIVNNIDSAGNDEVRAGWYYQLASVQVNTSYHGKAWMMFSYGKSVNEPYVAEDYNDNYFWSGFTFSPNNSRYGKDYYMCWSAIENYTKAFDLSKNKELKAKCMLGLATCAEFSYYTIEEKNRPAYLRRNKNLNFKLQQLKNYMNIKAFREAAVHCPDIMEYTKR